MNPLPLKVFDVDFSKHSFEELQLPILFKEQPPLLFCKTLAQFVERLDDICGGIISAFAGMGDMVLAGGCVLAAFITEPSYVPSDLDIFLTCDPEKGETVLKTIFEIVLKHLPQGKSQIPTMRSNAAVTIFRNGGFVPVQVILHTYKSVAQLLRTFDVDSCAIAYVPSTNDLWCTRRSKRALMFQTNIVDTRFYSRHYFA